MFGLAANDPQVIIVSNDPGQTPGNSTETTLDTEWAGAIAPKATIKGSSGSMHKLKRWRDAIGTLCGE